MVTCSEFADATSIDCLHPWGVDSFGVNCTEPSGFEPGRLWNITLNIFTRCPSDSRLWQGGSNPPTNSSAALTEKACEFITGPYLNRWLKATKYSNEDIWGRLSTWKFPLLQLVASSPRPPLGSSVEFFVISHLMGDPIGTMRDLLAKLSRCQQHADYWKDTFSEGMGWLNKTQSKRERNAFGMITMSYDEWGDGVKVQKILRDALAAIEKLNPGLRPHTKFEEVEMSIQSWQTHLSKTPDHDGQMRLAFRKVIGRLRPIEEGSRSRDRRKLSPPVPDAGPSVYRRAQETAPRSSINNRQLPKNTEVEQLINFLRLCNQTSDALAADRSTRLLPILVAMVFFIGAISVALVKTVADNGATLKINVEAHSIAFSSLYFWIISAVFLTSIIGVSQTENSMPSILDGFRVRLEHELDDYQFGLPEWKKLGDIEMRVACGGIYSWIPQDPPPFVQDKEAAAAQNKQNFIIKFARFAGKMLPELMVASSAFFAMVMSVNVPPKGWEARHCAQAMIFFTWLLSSLVTHAFKYISPTRGHRSWCFWLTCVKDFAAGLGVIVGIIVTQVGILNRCSSYTRWGKTGLYLPYQPDTAAYLKASIHSTYIIITVFGIALQLIVMPSYVWWNYGSAWKILMQRDDGKGNFRFPRLRWRRRKHEQPDEGESGNQISSKDLEARTFDQHTVALEGGGWEEQGRDSSVEVPLLRLSDDRTPSADSQDRRQQSAEPPINRKPVPQRGQYSQP